MERLLIYYNHHPDRMVDDVDQLERGENEELVRVAEQFCVDQRRSHFKGKEAMIHKELLDFLFMIAVS